MDCDVVVVGSGFGGLVSAALLAKHGYRVWVVEKHDRPGGFATEFRRKGYSFEVAVHSIEGYSARNVRSRIFDFLGLDRKVRFLEMENFYRLHGDKGRLDIPCSVEAAKDVLKKHYPCQAGGIDLFFEKMEAVSGDFHRFQNEESQMDFENPMFAVFYPDLFELVRIPLSHFVAELVSNEELRWLLISNIGFYHNDPSRYPAAFFLVNQSHYFAGGAVYTEGGTQRLSQALAEIVQENGGRLLLRSEVKKVEEEEGTVVVSVEPVSSHQEPFRIRARYGIVNAPIPYAYEKLFGSPAPADASLKPSVSASTLYLGLTKPFHELYPADFFNFFTQGSLRAGAMTANLDFSIVDSSVVDKSVFEKRRFTADLVFLDSYEKWHRARETGDYEDLKHQTIESLFGRLENLVPEIGKHVDVFELGSPLTIERFTNNSRGAAYGFDIASVGPREALRRLSLDYRPFKENSKRILFASAWSSLSHGLTGASLAAYQAANAILSEEGHDAMALREI